MADAAEPKSRLYKSVYSPTFLSAIYDHYVLGFNMKYMWGCAADSVLLPFFSDNLSRRHMDVGVATGFFPAAILNRPVRRREQHTLTLVDFNEHSLRAAESRVLAAAPRAVVDTAQADITAPLPKALEGRSYDSISMFNLFHCVPGTLEKLKAFRTYKELLSDDGVLAGCTVLGHKHATGWFRKLYLRLYNHLDIFNNWEDEKEVFERVLREEFSEVEIEVVGMMLLFKASKPVRSSETV